MKKRIVPIIEVEEKEGVVCVKVQAGQSDRKERPVFLYLTDGILIDTGPQRLEKEIISFFEKYSNNIELLALTHSHEDHTGNASWIQENLEVPIYVHPNGMDICRKRSPYPEYRKITWGIRKEFFPSPLEGESLGIDWEVIYTPGHADDHIAFYHKPTFHMFTGDLFVAPKTRVIMNNESIPVIMDSIRKVLTYDFTSLYCSHAGYFKDGKNQLERKLDYLENIYNEVVKMYKEGYSPLEINKRIFPKTYPIEDYSDGEWGSTHIITSIISHIDQKSFS